MTEYSQLKSTGSQFLAINFAIPQRLACLWTPVKSVNMMIVLRAQNGKRWAIYGRLWRYFGLRSSSLKELIILRKSSKSKHRRNNLLCIITANKFYQVGNAKKRYLYESNPLYYTQLHLHGWKDENGASIEPKRWVTSVSQFRTFTFRIVQVWTHERTMGSEAEQFLHRRSHLIFLHEGKLIIYTSQGSQPPAVVRGLVPVAMAIDETELETSTASLLTALEVAKSSNRFQVNSLFSCASICFTSSSSNLTKHSSKSSWSASENIFLTFRVKLWTAWFQCPLVFLSKAGKIIGSITLRFCVIKFLMWSLFHKNNARSATCQNNQIKIIHVNNLKSKSKSFRWSRYLVK